MSQTAIPTKWKFVVEFEDEDDETKEISGTIGRADTREECEGLLEHEMQYHRSHGRTIVNAEAVEICAKCEGEGKFQNGNSEQVPCDACGGHLGPISSLRSTLRPGEAEFLVILYGVFNGFSPRQAA